jgi:hypothetical protein
MLSTTLLCKPLKKYIACEPEAQQVAYTAVLLLWLYSLSLAEGW